MGFWLQKQMTSINFYNRYVYTLNLSSLLALNCLLWKFMQMAEGTGKSSLKSVDETLLQLKQQHGKYCKFRKRQTYTYYFISTSSSHVIACLAVRHSAVDPNLIPYLFLIFCRVQILHYFVLPFKKRIRWLLLRIMNKTRFRLWFHELVSHHDNF